MKLSVYIDGFNFYYGVYRHGPPVNSAFKWLNYRALMELAYPRDEIVRVRIFSAPVQARPKDLDQPNRQKSLWVANEVEAGVSIHQGRFMIKHQQVRVMNPSQVGHRSVVAELTEEKGSDVNLASYLLLDGFRGEYDAAVVVSDDSDLVEPIRMVRKELGLRVGILNPQPGFDARTGKRRRRRELEQACTSGFYKHLDYSLLPLCQLPDPVIDGKGNTIYKPKRW